MNWIDQHGFILLAAAYVFALIISAMPPLPSTAGWWTTFMYRALQVVAANADKVAKESPAMQRFTSKETKPSGEQHSEELVTTITPPKEQA